MSSIVPCAPSNRIDSPSFSAWFKQDCRVADEGRNLLGRLRIFRVHLVGVERFGVEERVRDHVLFAHGILDVLLEQLQIEQIGHAQAAAAHLVFVGWADAARGGADLDASRSIFRREFDHAVVGKDYVSAVRNEEMTVDFHPGLAQSTSLFQERERIEHDAIADDAAATGAQHAAGHELQNKFLAVDDDGVAGVVSAGVTGYNREVFRENVDDLAFAFIAPLGANNHRGFAFFQFQLRQGNFAQADGCAAPGVAHSLPAGMPSQKITGIRAEKTCTEYFIVSTR